MFELIKVKQIEKSPYGRLGPKMQACKIFLVEKKIKISPAYLRGYFSKIREAQDEATEIFNWCTENIGKRREDWFVERPSFPDFPCYIFIPEEYAVAFKLLYEDIS